MEQVIPWQRLTREFAPHYPDPQGPGRRPKGLERMLRIYFMQHWYNLSDPAMEEALYDSRAMREFARVDLGEERAPDESTILQFRHLMETHEFGAELLRLVNAYLAEKGCRSHGVRSWTRRLLRRPPRQRTGRRRGTLRCIKPAKATSGVCHKHRRQTCGAVPKMGEGLPKPACRSRLQTVRCCCV